MYKSIIGKKNTIRTEIKLFLDAWPVKKIDCFNLEPEGSRPQP